jgi:uncharacterized protein YyaL (SSP411 family)
VSACVLRSVLCAAALLVALHPAAADETVTLAQRQFASTSPAAPFEPFFLESRRFAASTTPAWSSIEGDLSAWGPALIFPLLGPGVPSETVLGLAAPLESEGTAPLLLFRTLGLYAAKSRVPFIESRTVRDAVSRNLRTLERATNDLDSLTANKELAGWGSIGAGAWLAYLELLYRDYFELEDAGAGRWNADGVRIVDELLVRGRLPDGGFRRDPRDDALSLWPTALAIHALVQAYENQELVQYESAAVAAAAALDTLRAGDGSYFSNPAKAERDPRANAYVAGALLLLFKDTGDVQYRDRAVALLRWLTTGAAANASARDAALASHVGYLAMLLDSLATQPYENILGRRPMRLTVELGSPSAKSVDAMAAQLHPADFRYRDLFDTVLHTLVERVPQSAGDIAYDYGDAPGYAASVLLDGGDKALAPQIVERQERLLAWPHPRDFDEMSFGAAALFAAHDHPDAVDAPAAERSLRRYVFLSGALAMADRYYLDWLDWLTGGGSFEYGPTVIGAQIATTQLHYATGFPDQRVGWFLRPLHVGQALIDGADHSVWDAAQHVYRARPDDATIRLLPNAMMIIDLLQAHALTPEPSYLSRAEEVAGGLDALWDDKRGAYFASSEQTGDDAYESLSTNSYVALALLRLAKATDKPAYRDRALKVFDFINHDLYADGVIYHHLYQGRRATGDIWCTGCNWRVLSELAELAQATQ